MASSDPETLRWASSFAITRPPASTLQGDKINLPQSALEQLLAASPTTRVPSASTFTAFDPRNPYSVAAARQEMSFYGEVSQQLPNPLMFRLVNQANGSEVYAGIREFSSAEGEMAISSYLMDALGLPEEQLAAGTSVEMAIDIDSEANHVPSGPHVTVRAEQLPKGTYVRLRPLEAGYNPDDWKSLLERELRNSYTTLTKNTILAVRGVKGEEFRFLVDKFAPEGNGVCVVDTDLEVDIEALNEEQARETMRQIMSKAQPGSENGSSKGGEIDIWRPAEGQVLPGEYVDYELASWDRSQPLVIELGQISLEDQDTIDLFVSPKSRLYRSLPRDTDHVLGDFSRAEHGVKSLTIQPTNVALDHAESLLISVAAYSLRNEISDKPRPCGYTLRVKMAGTGLPNGGHNAESESKQPSADDAQCKNCLQWVPKRTMVLHENFCLRNNILCPHCRLVFQKSSSEWKAHWHCPHDDAFGDSEASKAKHDDVYHTKRQCQSCEYVAPSLIDLALHRTSLCPGKLILCQFCHLEVPQEGDPFNPSAEAIVTGLTAHELADGARTTDCHLCGKIVRLRDMSSHLKHHELDKATRSKPDICRNANCGRTLHGVNPRGGVGSGTAAGQGPGNDLGLCSLCFAPLYVSMHDPEGKALRRRIERRYLSQLMTGCGKKWCGNEWCKTGRANLGLEAKGSSAQAALPLAKILMTNMNDLHDPMYFCVDESSQKRKNLARMMAEEKAWDLEWCVAACEAAGGNLDKAREWLMNWAPTR